MNDNLPKSLHTVRVLVVMAHMIRNVQPKKSCADAVSQAAALLGYAITPDTYGLKAKAVAQLEAKRVSFRRAS